MTQFPSFFERGQAEPNGSYFLITYSMVQDIL